MTVNWDLFQWIAIVGLLLTVIGLAVALQQAKKNTGDRKRDIKPLLQHDFRVELPRLWVELVNRGGRLHIDEFDFLFYSKNIGRPKDNSHFEVLRIAQELGLEQFVVKICTIKEGGCLHQSEKIPIITVDLSDVPPPVFDDAREYVRQRLSKIAVVIKGRDNDGNPYEYPPPEIQP